MDVEDAFEVDGVHVKRLYEGQFENSMMSQAYRGIYDLLCSGEVREQFRAVLEADEVWIKPNLSNARPPETGCNTHPATVRAVLDYLYDFQNFRKPVRLCETVTFHKGPGITEILARLPPKEREVLEEKLKRREPSQDIHDFGFNLLLELCGVVKLVKGYRERGFDIDILNLSKETVMSSEEKREVGGDVDELLGREAIPKKGIRTKLLDNLPKILGEGRRISLISLAVPKTHDEPEVEVTATMKNLAVGLFPWYKAFMHKDIARAIVYNYALWKRCCGDRVFGVVSGPYGMGGEGPIFGGVADFPYVVAGSDLLRVDCVTAVLMFGRTDVIDQIKVFKYSHGKVGQMPSTSKLEELIPYGLNYHPYPRGH